MMDEAVARNLVLLFMVLLQNAHVFNCRSETVSALKVPLRRKVILVFGVLAAQGIHIASMHLPFMQSVLGIEPIPVARWLLCLGLALSVLVVIELFKLINIRRPFAA
jgi:magnesium-transporting ATPase (P-type)